MKGDSANPISRNAATNLVSLVTLVFQSAGQPDGIIDVTTARFVQDHPAITL